MQSFVLAFKKSKEGNGGKTNPEKMEESPKDREGGIPKEITKSDPFKEFEMKLAKIKLLTVLETKLNYSKTRILFGVGGGFIYAILIVANVKADLLTDLLALLYPGYQSFKAIEDGEKGQFKQWLAYWYPQAYYRTLLGLVNFLEHFKWIHHIFPFFYALKAIFVIWLFLPSILGASFIYNTIVQLWMPRIHKIAESVKPTKVAPKKVE